MWGWGRVVEIVLAVYEQCPSSSASGIFLSLSKFVVEILERALMKNSKPCRTSIDTKSKLGPRRDPVSDPTYIATSLVGNGYSQKDKNKAKTKQNQARGWKECGKLKLKAYAS
ncbi:hypothetical protein Tco_0364951 [Tanacetum coccineum]